MSDTRNQSIEIQQQLKKVLDKYKSNFSQNSQQLRHAIPVTDMWRFFVEERIQRNGRSVSTFLTANEFQEYGKYTIAEYPQKKQESDEIKNAAEEEALIKAFNSLGVTSHVKRAALFSNYKEIKENNDYIDRYLNTEVLKQNKSKILELLLKQEMDYRKTLNESLNFHYMNQFASNSIPNELSKRYTLNDLLLLDKGLTAFELNEPGYFAALYSTFDKIFQEKSSDITIDQIKNFHQLATAKVLKEKTTPGKFRVQGAEYFKLILGRNCSRNGLATILEKNLPYLSFAIFEVGVGTKHYTTLTVDDLVSYLSNEKYEVRLTMDDESRQPYVNAEIARLLAIYQRDITNAQTDLDKIKSIVNFVQSCEQLHPFYDGNCRTFCMVMLNDLLIQNGFPLSIMSDPNKFDGYSPDELVIEVIKGMENVFYLIEHAQDPLFGWTTAGMIEDLKKVNQPEIQNLVHYFQELNQMEITNRQQMHGRINQYLVQLNQQINTLWPEQEKIQSNLFTPVIPTIVSQIKLLLDVNDEKQSSKTLLKIQNIVTEFLQKNKTDVENDKVHNFLSDINSSCNQLLQTNQFTQTNKLSF